MSDFNDHWLGLREPADHRARASRLHEAVLATRPTGTMQIVDLGTGTGSNLRYLAPALGPDQRWILFDHDAELLTRLPDILFDWAAAMGYEVDHTDSNVLLKGAHFSASVEWRERDLADHDALSRLPQAHLYTGSALLDLVSSSWIDRLVALCQLRSASCLFAMTYTGQHEWTPAMDFDNDILTAVNRHQNRDKGLGAALGPTAAAYLHEALCRLDFSSEAIDSDWLLGTESQQLQVEFASGLARAALEVAPDHAVEIQAWNAERLRHCLSGDSRLRVSHTDVLGQPAA